MLTIINKYSLLFLTVFISPISARKLITGDVQLRDQNSTFSFPAHAYCMNKNNRIYVGAAHPGMAKDFSLCFLDPRAEQFKPFAQETIIFNGLKDQPNSIYNAKIKHLVPVGFNLALTLAHTPNTVYLLEPSDPCRLFSVSEFSDASPVGANTIVALEGSQEIAYVALGKQEQNEHNPGFTLAAIKYHQKVIEKELSENDMQEIQKKLEGKAKDEIEHALKNIKTNKEGKKIQTTVLRDFKQLGKTITIDNASPLFKNGNDLRSLGDNVVLHWSDTLERLYVGFQVESGAQEEDAACAIAVGYCDEMGDFKLNPIVDFKTITRDGNQIIGGRGAQAKASVHNIKTMQTTTGFLDYLIIQGGNGDSEQSKRNVYALPLLNYGKTKIISPENQRLQGRLASVNASPLHVFQEISSEIKTSMFLGRHFVTPPKNFSDLYTSTSMPAHVGGGPLLAGPISELMVKDDAVYAVVTQPDKGFTESIYHSQALFGADGQIVAWTAWRKVFHAEDENLFGVIFDRAQGINTIMSGNKDEFKTVQRAEWQSEGLGTLVKAINDHFSPENGGIHALIEFNPTNPGIDGTAFLCALGYSNCILAQTICNAPDIHEKAFEHGIIDQIITPDTSIIHFAGTHLEQLAPLTCAEIGINDTNGWLFIGGVHGLCVLCAQDGTGWQMPRGLGVGFDGLVQGMGLVPCGDYTFVKKLIADDHYLYVLTDTCLDRIDLRTWNPKQLQNSTVRLANARDLTKSEYSLFYDCIISDKFALLAHNTGLSRVGNGKDIRSDDFTTLDWTPIQIPDQKGPVVALVPVSVNGRAQDICRFEAGQLFVLHGYIGKNNTQINRFVLHSVLHSDVSEYTLEPLHDYITPEKISKFATVGAYSSLFVTDGSMFLSGVDRKKIMPATVVNGFGAIKTALPLKIPKAMHISDIVRSTEFGNLLVAGDFGLYINE